MCCPRNEVVPPAETLSDRITEQVLAALQANPDSPVRLAHKITNVERAVGARVSGQLALRYGDAGSAAMAISGSTCMAMRARALVPLPSVA